MSDLRRTRTAIDANRIVPKVTKVKRVAYRTMRKARDPDPFNKFWTCKDSPFWAWLASARAIETYCGAKKTYQDEKIAVEMNASRNCFLYTAANNNMLKRARAVS